MSVSIADVVASVIIPVWNGRRYLAACLDALLSQDYADLEVIAVDNASADGSARFVAENYPQVNLVRHSRNLGFAGGCNAGLRTARGDLLLLLNQDAVVQPGWLRAIAGALKDPQIGVAGCKILEADGKTLNHCGGVLDMDAIQTQHRGAGEVDRGQYDEAMDVEFVTGAAFALRRDVLERVGLMDELFYPGYYEDTDYCIRVRRAGLRIRYVPDAVVVHHVSASTRQNWVRMRHYYYRNRIFCALKHLPPDRFVDKFVLLERERLCTLAPGELYAAQLALPQVLARWPYLATRLPERVSPRSVEQVSDSLHSLLDFVAHRRGQDTDLSPILSALGATRRARQGAMGALLPSLEDMRAMWQIRQQTGRSSLLGSLLAWVRTAWRLLTAGGYRALFWRQSRFNRIVSRAVSLLAAQLWDDESAMALLADRYGEMVARVAALEARLAELERGSAAKEDGHG